MIPRALKPFISELIESTSDRNINWREGAPQAYFCAHKDYNLHIRNYFDEDAEISYIIFRIVQGQKDASFSVSSNEADFAIMSDLYQNVGVNAVGFDDIAADFFK